MSGQTRLRTTAQLATKLPRNLLLYDGLCLYSNDRVTKVLEHNLALDKTDKRVIHVAPRESVVGRYVMQLQPANVRAIDGIFFVEKRPKQTFLQRFIPGLAGDQRGEDFNIHVYTKSQAVFRIVANLDHMYLPYVGSVAYWVLPRRFTDMIFDWIARTRYAKFGKASSPVIPTEEIKARTWTRV
jgi:predicted DCC family thiol-disulfide oxidoreductase YuxK